MIKILYAFPLPKGQQAKACIILKTGQKESASSASLSFEPWVWSLDTVKLSLMR